MKAQKVLFTVLISLLPALVMAQKVGDKLHGGIVFYINEPVGYILIAAPDDQAKKIKWGKNGNYNATAMDDGRENVTSIKSSPKDFAKNACFVCDTLKLAGYDDWYLPAINELEKMYQQREVVGRFASADYCSSTEKGKDDSWNVHFRAHTRVVFYYNKDDNDYNVRCIRRYKI